MFPNFISTIVGNHKNHGNVTQTQKPLIHIENMAVLAIHTSMNKRVRFPSRNELVLSYSLIITLGKASTVTNLNKSDIHKLF